MASFDKSTLARQTSRCKKESRFQGVRNGTPNLASLGGELEAKVFKNRAKAIGGLLYKMMTFEDQPYHLTRPEKEAMEDKAS
jgi:hypothetical protein